MIFALLACAGSGDADRVCTAERLPDPVESDAWSIGVEVPFSAGAARVLARWPNGSGDWPVVVVVHGGWTASGTDFETVAPYLSPGGARVVLHVDLPGSAWTDGDNDRRGPASRAAVAAALAWAAGDQRDLGGCTLADRTVGADPDRIVVLGGSNGGNLAIATLADSTLDAPAVVGLVVWETPAGAQFAGVELGADPTVYQPGSCTFEPEAGIRCAIPADQLRADSELLCFDLDGDSRCSSADVRIPGVSDPLSEQIMASRVLVEAAEAAGILPDGWADAETADAWWAERDGARGAAALVDARPDLPVILVASEEDHVQTLSDHPHVFGLGEALQAAGVRWLRLNPGEHWLPDSDENEPNAPLFLADPQGHLLTEEQEAPLEQPLAAAVQELLDRTESGEW